MSYQMYMTQCELDEHTGSRWSIVSLWRLMERTNRRIRMIWKFWHVFFSGWLNDVPLKWKGWWQETLRSCRPLFSFVSSRTLVPPPSPPRDSAKSQYKWTRLCSVWYSLHAWMSACLCDPDKPIQLEFSSSNLHNVCGDTPLTTSSTTCTRGQKSSDIDSGE